MTESPARTDEDAPPTTYSIGSLPYKEAGENSTVRQKHIVDQYNLSACMLNGMVSVYFRSCM